MRVVLPAPKNPDTMSIFAIGNQFLYFGFAPILSLPAGKVKGGGDPIRIDFSPLVLYNVLRSPIRTRARRAGWRYI